MEQSLTKAAHLAQELILKESAASEAAALSPKSARRVLILDGCRTFARRVETLLSAEDFLVYSFAEVSKVEEMIDLVHPDLLVLDISMPGVDVLETCRQLRDRESSHKLPILLVYGTLDHQLCSQALAAGGNAILPKSAANTDFLNKICGYLSPGVALSA